MAMSSELNPPPSEQDIAPLNFVYACSICCALLADVYKNSDETVQGFSDGINPKERLVTKLFLASCCHVFCAKHVEGGNPTFHPVGERPKAPCPVCIKEKNDREPRDLYSVRGFTKDEYDPHIPVAWFTAPPIRLDGNGKEMDALRFQYLALIRYCQNTYTKRKTLHNTLLEVEKKRANMEDMASENHAKLLNLQQEHEQKQEQLESMKAEVQRLQGIEDEVEQYRHLNVNPRDLETFINNKAAIRHYLKLLPMLIDQNDKMKSRLASLGFAMALEPVPNFKDIDPKVFDSDEVDTGAHAAEHRGWLRKTTSSHTVGRSAHNSGRATAIPSSPFSSRPMKRQRLDSPMRGNMHLDPPASRDVMPPPPKPLSRMQSVRKIFPSWRRKFSNGRSTPIPGDDLRGNSSMQAYGTMNRQGDGDDRPPTRYGLPANTPLMSGALPPELPMQDSKTPKSQMLSSMGLPNSGSDFTFRAPSPLKRNTGSNGYQPSPLPNEPSYMRLMDGLSRDTGLELGLRDPRVETMEDYDNSARTEQNRDIYTENRQSQDHDSPTRWPLGHPFLLQAPPGPSSLADVQPEPPRFSPTHGFFRRPEIQTNGLLTPEYNGSQRPGFPAENVVSPFFEHSHDQAPPQARTGFAEPQDSLRRFRTSQSHNVRKRGAQADWHKPPSLNVLSFFNSPVNSLNQPIQFNHDFEPVRPIFSSRYYEARDLGPREFATHVGTSGPDTSWNKLPPCRRHFVSSQSANALPVFQRSTYTRSYQLPSAMPPSIPHRFPPRERQWDNLRRAGVRSSRQAFRGEMMDPRPSVIEPRSYASGRHRSRR